MMDVKLKWNVDGSILALCGIQNVKNNQGDDKDSCVIQLWSPYGEVVLIYFSYFVH